MSGTVLKPGSYRTYRQTIQQARNVSAILCPVRKVVVPHYGTLSANVVCRSSKQQKVLQTMQTIDADDAEISGLDRDYCDDFVCTSSPAVEQTVRSMAREIERGKYATRSLYAPTVTYEDGFRSFKGPEGYTRQRWLVDNVDNLRVSILKMEMVDKSTAVISWRATGNLGAAPVNLQFRTTLTLNLLTGRVESHKETWDLSKCAPPAALNATINRTLWSLQQRVKDAQEGLGKATDKLSSSLGGGDDVGSASNNGALDPTRFYQQGGSPNSDYFSLGLVVALLYLAFKFFGELERLS